MPYAIQRVLAAISLLVLGPLILVLAVAVRLASRGPAFHRATRARPGGTFTLFKLRTMRVGAEASGPGITAAGDPRITGLGRFLRRTKLDELPQLWNVVRGDMALVGPRPEDPRYVDLADPLHARVFGARPGITGPTAIAYRDEERILAETAGQSPSAEALETAYRDVLLPAKLRSDELYLAKRSFRGDLEFLWRTIWSSRRPS